MLEPAEVDGVRRRHQRRTRRPRDERVAGRAERLAQLGDPHVQRRDARCRLILAPQLVHQAVGGDDLAAVQQQDPEQRALCGAGQRHGLAVLPDL